MGPVRDPGQRARARLLCNRSERGLSRVAAGPGHAQTYTPEAARQPGGTERRPVVAGIPRCKLYDRLGRNRRWRSVATRDLAGLGDGHVAAEKVQDAAVECVILV